MTSISIILSGAPTSGPVRVFSLFSDVTAEYFGWRGQFELSPGGGTCWAERFTFLHLIELHLVWFKISPSSGRTSPLSQSRTPHQLKTHSDRLVTARACAHIHTPTRTRTHACMHALADKHARTNTFSVRAPPLIRSTSSLTLINKSAGSKSIDQLNHLSFPEEKLTQTWMQMSCGRPRLFPGVSVSPTTHQ